MNYGTIHDYKRPLDRFERERYELGFRAAKQGQHRAIRAYCRCPLEDDGGDCPYCYGYFAAIAYYATPIAKKEQN